MSDEEKRHNRIQECRFSIRAVCSTLVNAFGVDIAISVLKDEYRELKDLKMEGQPASDEFERAVGSSGTIRATCEFCGVTYFVSDGDYDHGELEELRELAKKNPTRYVEDGRYDMIDVGYIEGKLAVLGCSCNKIAVYEKWIWNHRWIISSYLESRAKDAEFDAKFAREIADKTKASTEVL